MISDLLVNLDTVWSSGGSLSVFAAVAVLWFLFMVLAHRLWKSEV